MILAHAYCSSLELQKHWASASIIIRNFNYYHSTISHALVAVEGKENYQEKTSCRYNPAAHQSRLAL
jgi:hypothetical protein